MAPESVPFALNAQLLSRASTFRSGGISRVIYHLLAELARDPRGYRYDVFAPFAPDEDDPLFSSAVCYHPTGGTTTRPAGRIAWEQSILPLRLAQRRSSLLHSLAYASPLAWRGPTVLSIYDLSFLRFPGTFNRANRAYLSVLTRISARRARRIITISEHSRADIVALLGVPPQRVVVAYPAADGRYRPLPQPDVDAFQRAQHLPEAFMLTLGTLEPRKNLMGLLQAYERLPEPRLPLYVAGGSGWRFTPILDFVRTRGLGGSITFLGFVPEAQLPLWYNSARLFVFPSLYEGFGLPVLEAMACGTPVITSTAASLPEVAGTAALTVDPTNPGALAGAMQELLNAADRRAEMRHHGLLQAARFTWRGMTDTIVHTYAAALEIT